MKKILLLVLCVNLLLTSCNNDDDAIPEESIVNTAPTTPVLNYPTNNLVCIENAINFQWTPSSDAEGNVPIYDIEIATDINFTQELNSVTTIANSKEIVLEKGKLYYWRMRAKDTKDATSEYSEVFNFYTEGNGVLNHLPFAPVLISPEINTVESDDSTVLKWSAEDADEDNLLFDIYLGNDDLSLDIIANNITESEYHLDLPNIGEYFWKIIVKDGKGGTTVGQIWNFTKE